MIRNHIISLSSLAMLVSCAHPGYKIESVDSKAPYSILNMKGSGAGGWLSVVEVLSGNSPTIFFEELKRGGDGLLFRAGRIGTTWQIVSTNHTEMKKTMLEWPPSPNYQFLNCMGLQQMAFAVSQDGKLNFGAMTLSAKLPETFWFKCQDRPNTSQPSIIIAVSKSESTGTPPTASFSSKEGSLAVEFFAPSSGERMAQILCSGRTIRMTFDQFGSYTTFARPIIIGGFFVWQANVWEVVVLDLRSYLRIIGAERK